MLPNSAGVTLVNTVYGDDLADKSYREAQGLIAKYPNLRAKIAPSNLGILAASQAVRDGGLIGKVNVTGLGLPSERAGAAESGAAMLDENNKAAMFDPLHLGCQQYR